MREPKPCQGAHGLGLLFPLVRFSFNEPWHCAIIPGRKFSLIPPGYLTFGILSSRRSTFSGYTRISHIRNSVRPTFHPYPDVSHPRLSDRRSIHPDISHPESCPPTFHPPGCLTFEILSADVPSTWISHIWRLSPDGRGGWFNFPGQTCLDPSVTPIRSAHLTCPRSPHLAPGVWTTKPPGFPCFPPRLSWVKGLPMKPISPGLNQVAKGLTPTIYLPQSCYSPLEDRFQRNKVCFQ